MMMGLVGGKKPAGGGAAYVGPGDIATFSHWWGLRAYSAADIGNNLIRLREDGGNTEQNFASIAGGGLDLTAITTFKGANNLFVVTLFDRVGAVDLTQATTANQPAFTLNGIGALPIMTFTRAALKNLGGSGTITQAQPLSLTVTARRTGTTNAINDLFGDTTGVHETILFTGSANTIQMQEFGSNIAATANDNTWHTVMGMWNGAAPNSKLIIDAAVTTGDGGTLSFSGTTIILGGRTGGSGGFDGDAVEAGMINSDGSASATSLNSNSVAYGYA